MSILGQIDNIVEQELEGDFDPRLIATLNPQELLLYEDLKRELRSGNNLTYDQLWRLDYVAKPPSIEQFIDDDYYLGWSLRHSDDNEGLWPAWKKILMADFDLDSRLYNIVLTGSIGTGKTTVMIVLMLYRILWATLLKNPQHFFGLNRNSPIVYCVLSVTKQAVKNTAFRYAKNFMRASAYFKEVCHFDVAQDYGKFEIPMLNTLPNGQLSEIYVTAGSKSQHVIGQNVNGIALDEGNFRLEKDPDLTAYELYNKVRIRLANRFQKRAGFLPAVSIISSSAEDESSFTEKVSAEIEALNEPDREKVYRHASYEIKRHTLILEKEWFKVAYGLRNIEPVILSGWYTEQDEATGTDLHEEPPKGCRTVLVPKDYFKDFRRNCREAMRDLAGISTGGTYRLFPSTIDIEKCISLSEQEGIVNPCTVDFIPLSMENDQNIWDFLDHKSFLTRVHSRIQPKRHPDHYRYAHIDLATQSVAGLSICHLAGNQLVDGLVRDGQPFSEYRVVVEYDFILGIIAGQTKPISLEKIQRFFFWLRDFCGYRFKLITSDTWQSELSLQMLEARGFEVDKLSIDRDKSVYNAWRSGFEDLRIRLFRQHQMIRDAENLIEMDKKYDAPVEAGTHKDVSDSAAGAHYGAISSDEKSMINSANTPGVFTSRTVEATEAAPPIITIPIPAKGYDRTKTFEA